MILKQEIAMLKIDLQVRLAGIREVLFNAFSHFRQNGDENQAAAIAFYAILSTIPFVLLTLIAAGVMFGSHPAVQEELIRFIRSFHPYFSGQLIAKLGAIEEKRRVLGWVGILSLLWVSSLIFASIEQAFNQIFRSQKGRSYLASKVLALAMIPLGWLLAGLSVAITSVALLVEKNPLIAEGRWLAGLLVHGIFFSYVMPFCLMVVFFTLVYKIIPKGVSWMQALIAACIFSILMEVAKHAFTMYITNFTSYNVIYGSLETIIILVIWVFYVSLILLFCAELISSFQRRDIILLERAFLGKHDSALTSERLFRKFGRIYRKGEYVFREGETGSDMYYLLEGRVNVEKQAGQVTKTIMEMGPGQYFGEMAALVEGPRTASVRSLETSNIAVIDSGMFHNVLRESSNVSLILLREFSKRIKNTNELLQSLAQEWIKLLAIFYFIKEWPVRDGVDPASQIARSTGKEESEIREVISNLCRKGILEMQDGRVRRLHLEAAWKILEESPVVLT